jgi:hypothetical protein
VCHEIDPKNAADDLAQVLTPGRNDAVLGDSRLNSLEAATSSNAREEYKRKKKQTKTRRRCCRGAVRKTDWMQGESVCDR